MRRIYSDYAYSQHPRSNCWWDDTIAAPLWPQLEDELATDVAIIGGGFTGISAALHLAQDGVGVAVLEAETPGWGASGRNGGFCCLGGTKLSSGAMRRIFGKAATDIYEASEVAAVQLVRNLLDTHEIDADTHSNGETQLAHSKRAARQLLATANAMRDAGAEPVFQTREQLTEQGMNAGFHAALTTPVGFALNPRKYLFGLAKAAQTAGATLFQNSAAQRVKKTSGGYEITTKQGILRASKLVIATNGYSSEDIPEWLAGRYMPTQSTVMVTRPLSQAELSSQGWHSHQMAYDTRNLLHYFRLMPDKRFLFGMRGGLLASPRSETAIRRKLRQDFDAMFPAWKTIETTHCWSGMVCLSRNLVPFIGAVPNQPDMFAGMCYHGNGVAMGSYAGRILSDLVLGRSPELPHSAAVQKMARFPFGRARRILMPPAYALLHLMD